MPPEMCEKKEGREKREERREKRGKKSEWDGKEFLLLLMFFAAVIVVRVIVVVVVDMIYLRARSFVASVEWLVGLSCCSTV